MKIKKIVTVIRISRTVILRTKEIGRMSIIVVAQLARKIEW